MPKLKGNKLIANLFKRFCAREPIVYLFGYEEKIYWMGQNGELQSK